MKKDRRRKLLKGTQWEGPDRLTDLVFGEIGYQNSADHTVKMCRENQQPVLDGTVISDLSDEAVRDLLTKGANDV